MTFQDIIDKQLKIVNDNDELITSNEFTLICEADYYRPRGEKWYSKHRELTTGFRKVGAKVASMATLGLYGIFRRATDTCRQSCKEIKGSRKRKCIALCNLNATKRVVDRIKHYRSELPKIKDPEKRSRAKEILDKEQTKWTTRYDKYKNQASSLSSMVTQLKFNKGK